MISYTTEEIRAAFREAGNLPHAGMAKLGVRELLWLLAITENSMHAIWTDGSTVTVKELRDAEKRQSSQLYSVKDLLQSIEDHREPEYPPGTTWQDSGKPPVPWYRTGDGMWLRFGREGEFSHNYPVRPLRRMDVT